jgi:hypothetical protein
MSKKPFINPTIILKAKIDRLRKENVELKRKYKKLEKKYHYLHNNLHNIIEKRIQGRLEALNFEKKYNIDLDS